jgi:hypothetical protein
LPFEVKIIRDSISPAGIRITTFELYYPRFIHAEFMTHRKLCRNASSSRAIPVSKLIQDALDRPAMPIHWGKNQPGMQANEELTGHDLFMAKEAWLQGRDRAVEIARTMMLMGVAKQIVNRILEPFTHIRVVVTATDWANFYALRRHPDAQPEMKHLADLMWDAQQASKPWLLKPGQWHLPYIEERDWDHYNSAPDETLYTDPGAINSLLMISTARCARVSYRLHDGRETSWVEDEALYQRLVGGHPKHASPSEHQATPDIGSEARWLQPELHGPFTGWIQHRKTIPGENIDFYEGVR